MIEIKYCNIGNLGNYVRVQEGKIVHCQSLPGAHVNAYYTKRRQESYNPWGSQSDPGDLLAFELIPGLHPELFAFRGSVASRNCPKRSGPK